VGMWQSAVGIVMGEDGGHGHGQSGEGVGVVVDVVGGSGWWVWERNRVVGGGHTGGQSGVVVGSQAWAVGRGSGRGRSVVKCTGNPWVISAIPIPIPIKTHTHGTGMGFFTGQFFCTLTQPIPVPVAGNPRVCGEIAMAF
jgi:hypothetical protein